MLISHYAGAHLDQFQRVTVEPGSVSVVHLGEGIPRILLVNDTGSLRRFAPDRRERGASRERPRSIVPEAPLPESQLPESQLMEGPEPESIRILASPAQMLALSRHGAEVAARGRPTCQFCGNPIDAEGHACPAMNGHSKRD